jgi:hypothetical protein
LAATRRSTSATYATRTRSAPYPLDGDTQIPPGWQVALQGLYPRGFWLLTFYFLYKYHEEELTDCENDMEEVRARRAGEPLARQLHGSYAGEWQAVSVLVANPGMAVEGAPSSVPLQPASPSDLADDDFPAPEYVGYSRRARGAVVNITSNVIEARDFTFMPVFANASEEIKLLGNHAKVFVSRGTHNNYPLEGTMTAPKADMSLPFGIEFLNACLAADNFDTLFEQADEAKEKANEVKRQARVIAIGLGKIVGAGILGALGGPAGVIVGVVLGGMAAVAEGLGGQGPTPLDEFDPGGPEEVPDVGPAEGRYGLVLAPPSVSDDVSAELAGEANVVAFNEAWALRLVNRDKPSQIWWPPDGTHPRGYSGLWGVVSERDPFNRRSGTEVPLFEAAFINSLLTERG